MRTLCVGVVKGSPQMPWCSEGPGGQSSHKRAGGVWDVGYRPGIWALPAGASLLAHTAGRGDLRWFGRVPCFSEH